MQLSYISKVMGQTLYGIDVESTAKKCRFGSSFIVHWFSVLLVSVLWEVSAALHSQHFILLVMKRGSVPDWMKSSWSLCCSWSRCSRSIWSVLNCMGVWLFWSVFANRGCFWQGCTWVITSKHCGKMFCAALQGMKPPISNPPPPPPQLCSPLSRWHANLFKQIQSLLSHLINKSVQIWLLPPPVAPSFPEVGGECLWNSPFLDAGC